MTRCALCGGDSQRFFDCHVLVRCSSHLREPNKSELDVIHASCGHPVLRKDSDGWWIDVKTGEPARFNFPPMD